MHGLQSYNAFLTLSHLVTWYNFFVAVYHLLELQFVSNSIRLSIWHDVLLLHASYCMLLYHMQDKHKTPIPEYSIESMKALYIVVGIPGLIVDKQKCINF